jgi:hypothetical protein
MIRIATRWIVALVQHFNLGGYLAMSQHPSQAMCINISVWRFGLCQTEASIALIIQSSRPQPACVRDTHFGPESFRYRDSSFASHFRSIA